MSRNSSQNLVFPAGSTTSSPHPVVADPPDFVETVPLFQTFPPKCLHDATRSKLGGKTLPVRQVSRSSVSMSNRRLIGTDPALESLRFAANCRARVGRVLDTRLKTSDSE